MNLRTLSLTLLLSLLLISGVGSSAAFADPKISDERPLLLSELAAVLRQGASPAQLQAMSTAISAALTAVPSNGASPVVLTSAQKAQLGGLVQGALAGDQRALAALDQFPGWNIPDMGKGLRLELSELKPSGEKRPNPTPIVEALGIPAADQTLPTTKLKPLGHGLFRGSVVDPKKAKRHPDSKRLAAVFNRLSMNGTGWVTYKGNKARTPRGVLQLLLKDGHRVRAYDYRAIANFSALYFQAPGESALREVVAPLWLDSRVPVPNGAHTLLVPATHSELVFEVRGPVVNADIAFYLGTDNQATFRTNSGRDPSWVGGATIRRFAGRDALRAASAASWVRRNLVRLSQSRELHKLRSGAYGQLGVCNDATALVEGVMGLEATHWPLVRLPELYKGTRRLQRVSDSLPYDTDPAVVPSMERVMNSIPFAVGKVPELFPTLSQDMDALANAMATKKGAANITSENLED